MVICASSADQHSGLLTDDYVPVRRRSDGRATRDFVSGGTPLGIVRQGLNEELSNFIVTVERNGRSGVSGIWNPNPEQR